MKGSIRTKGCHGFKYTNKYNDTRIMILKYVYLKFFEDDDERSINDVCRCRYYRVAPFMHKYSKIRTSSYRQMCMCRNNVNMSNFDHDEYGYSSMQDFIG